MMSRNIVSHRLLYNGNMFLCLFFDKNKRIYSAKFVFIENTAIHGIKRYRFLPCPLDNRILNHQLLRTDNIGYHQTIYKLMRIQIKMTNQNLKSSQFHIKIRLPSNPKHFPIPPYSMWPCTCGSGPLCRRAIPVKFKAAARRGGRRAAVALAPLRDRTSSYAQEKVRLVRLSLAPTRSEPVQGGKVGHW